MVDFESLTGAEPELLDGAAETFNTWSDALDQHAVDFRNRIINEITQPTVWQGDAADAAGRHCDNVRLAVIKSVDEMRELGPILSGAAAEIAAAQRAVRSAVVQAQGLGLTVGPDGAVTVPPLRNPTGAEHEARSQLHRSAKALTEQIDDAVKRASDADQSAADALRKNSPDVRDVDKIGDQLRRMNAKGKRAAELASRFSLLSDGERQELLELLKANSDDPTFAAAMLQELGPRGVLLFGGSTAVLGMGHDGDGVAKEIGRLQRELGQVLATGTDPRMEPHVATGWTAELARAGREKIDVGLTNYQPYGYQVLGAVLHSGTYSAEFLDTVGNDLLAFEKARPGAWIENSAPMADGFRLNYVDHRGLGYDPMSGLMRAMSHNPEAARQFFDPAAHPDTVKYLVDRVAMDDLPMSEAAKHHQGPYYNDFGHALEAATLRGEPDARAAAIAGEVVNDFGTRDGTGALPPMPDNLKDSVGRIISGYIGDVNDAVSDNPVRSTTWDDPAIPGHGEHHAVFDKGKVLTAMGEAAKDPDSYVTMYNAERAYSALAFDHAAGDAGSTLDERAALLEQNAKQSTEVFGALDNARADEIMAEHEAADKAYNNAIQARGGLANLGLGAVAGKIPVLGDGISLGVGSYLDTLVENSQHDSSGLSTKETAELFGNGRHQAAQLAAGAMWQHRMWPPDHPPPASLLPDGPRGEPVPITHMSEQQRQEFVTWAKGSGYAEYIGRVTGEIDDSYSVGKDLDRERHGYR